MTRVGTADALDLLWADAGAARPSVYIFINAHSSLLRRRAPEYASVLEDPAVVPLPDGASIALGAAVAGLGRLERSPGPDLFDAACRRASDDGTPIFLLGGGTGTADRLSAVLRERLPKLRIVGAETPPFGEWDEASDAICQRIRSSDARILWLGVSAPKQEVWAVDHSREIGLPIVCVGAAFDFLAGIKPRAPRLMRRIGLEWVHRLVSEPARVWRRYLFGNVLFLYDLLRLGGGDPPRPGHPR